MFLTKFKATEFQIYFSTFFHPALMGSGKSENQKLANVYLSKKSCTYLMFEMSRAVVCFDALSRSIGLMTVGFAPAWSRTSTISASSGWIRLFSGMISLSSSVQSWLACTSIKLWTLRASLEAIKWSRAGQFFFQDLEMARRNCFNS